MSRPLVLNDDDAIRIFGSNYTVLRRLGEGGQGTVVAAECDDDLEESTTVHLSVPLARKC